MSFCRVENRPQTMDFREKQRSGPDSPPRRAPPRRDGVPLHLSQPRRDSPRLASLEPKWLPWRPCQVPFRLPFLLTARRVSGQATLGHMTLALECQFVLLVSLRHERLGHSRPTNPYVLVLCTSYFQGTRMMSEPGFALRLVHLDMLRLLSSPAPRPEIRAGCIPPL